MSRMVKKLSGLEIDEVSLVDRPANQHGLVAIAKRQEQSMSDIFDADGNEVDEDELEHGDVVYGEDGQQFVFVEDDVEDDEEAYEDQDQMVGKKLLPLSTSKAKAAGRLGRMKASDLAGRASAHVGRHSGYYGLGAGGAAGAGAGFAGGRVGKGYSLGDEVLEELSKALTDDDRDMVIAKAMNVLENVSKRNDELEQVVSGLLSDRQESDYVELAKGYEIPGSAEGIGGLLYRASQVLPEEDVAALDQLFSSIGYVGKSDSGFYDELGFGGQYEEDVLSQVYAAAGDIVVKADGGLSPEQATTAIFASNPAAYDEYEAEQRRR